jgi:hypothetical protein
VNSCLTARVKPELICGAAILCPSSNCELVIATQGLLGCGCINGSTCTVCNNLFEKEIQISLEIENLGIASNEVRKDIAYNNHIESINKNFKNY